MLYKALLKIKTSKGFDDAMRTKIDVFYALGRLTAEEYRNLLDLPDEGTNDSEGDADAETVQEAAD